jgi:hypothetical protein
MFLTKSGQGKRQIYVCHISEMPLLDLIFVLWYHIQGDSGGICNALGNDSMCDSKQKSSYEHGSDFEQLPRLW